MLGARRRRLQPARRLVEERALGTTTPVHAGGTIRGSAGDRMPGA